MKYFSLLSFLVNSIPKSLLRPIATIIAKGLVIFLKRERNIAAAQIKFVLGTNDFKPILEDAYKNSVLSVLEVFRFNKIFDTKPTKNKPNSIKPKMGDVSFENTDLVNTLLRENKSAICLGAHFSNFDLMTAYFSFQGVEMNAFARTVKYGTVQKLVTEIRKNYGVKVLLRDDPKTTTGLLKSLKNGAFICALIDQDINIESKFTPFFGLDANYPIGPIKIAIKFKMPVLFVYCVRNQDNSFKIGMSKIDWEHAKDIDPIQYILERYTEQLEELIRKYPGQWVWWHRRWRRRPGIDYQRQPEMLLKTDKYVEWVENLGNA